MVTYYISLDGERRYPCVARFEGRSIVFDTVPLELLPPDVPKEKPRPYGEELSTQSIHDDWQLA